MAEHDHVDLLLAEDTETDAEMILRSLKKNNFTGKVHWVKDGQEALEFLYCEGAYTDRDIYDLPRVILLDIKMPRVDGIEVLEVIKFDEYLRVIPVVVMTSSSEERDLLESYKLGANGYIVKPADYKEFEEAVGQVGTYWMKLNRTPNQSAS